MRAAIVVGLIALTTVGMAHGATSVRTDADGVRVLDRTYQCAVFFRGGAYLLDAHSHSGTRRAGSWARLPYAGVRSGVFSGAAGNLMVWITSGKPTPATTVDQDYDTFDVKTFGTVGIRREGCRKTSVPVALTTAGLRGAEAVPLGSEFECYAPKQVVVHVRAELAGTGALNSGQDFQATHVPVRKAKLAIRTLEGKPLVYADVSEDGRARLFAAQNCPSR